jgi:hypothetical protein
MGIIEVRKKERVGNCIRVIATYTDEKGNPIFQFRYVWELNWFERLFRLY